MKVIFTILLVLITFDFIRPSSTRLDSLSAPVWALQDDTESIDLSPALITRFNGSGILVDAGFSFFDNTISNVTIYSNSQYLDFTRTYSNSIKCRFAYLTMQSVFGYGLILTPYIIFNGNNYVFNPSGSPIITYEQINNLSHLNPIELSLLFGFKISDSVSIGIKPNFSYKMDNYCSTDTSNSITLDSNTNITTQYTYGADVGLNIMIGDNLFGLFGNISISPLQNSNQSFSANGGILGEFGSFKGIIKCLFYEHSYINVIDSIEIQPILGISYHTYIFDTILTILGIDGYYYNNGQNGFGFNCFAGFENRFNEFITGRFGLSFTPYAGYFATTISYDSGGSVIGTGSIYEHLILGNLKLTSGLSFFPLKSLSIDMLWSISPNYNMGLTNSIDHQYHSFGMETVDSTQGFELSISMSITYKF